MTIEEPDPQRGVRVACQNPWSFAAERSGMSRQWRLVCQALWTQPAIRGTIIERIVEEDSGDARQCREAARVLIVAGDNKRLRLVNGSEPTSSSDVDEGGGRKRPVSLHRRDPRHWLGKQVHRISHFSDVLEASEFHIRRHLMPESDWIAP